jgi:hypothetical protein
MIRLAILVVAFACPWVLAGDDKPPRPQKEEQKGGKPVNGLAAVAELTEQPDGWVEVRLSIKNMAEKPVTVCSYSSYYCFIDPTDSHVQVQWTGPNGKKFASKHHNYPPANNPPVGKQDFVAIAPGKSLRIYPTVRFHPTAMKPVPEERPATDPDLMDKWSRSNAAEAGEHRVVVSFANKFTSYPRGRGAGGVPNDFVEVEGVWTGKVAANEVTFKVN